MKLVEIKDVRVGQVWKNKYGDTLLVKNVSILHNENIDVIQWNKDINLVNWLGKYKKDLITHQRTSKEYITKNACNWKLIGFIGITHKIKGNKIVEIPREDFEVDDIVTLSDVSQWVLIHKQVSRKRCFDGICVEEVQCAGIFVDKSIKIGILGVTHEFINERLVK